MSRSCTVCNHERRPEIEKRVRSGSTFLDIERYLRDVGAPVGRMSLSRHAGHAGLAPALGRKPGPRPLASDFATAVRDRAAERLAAGEIDPDIRAGLGAQKLLDDRAARQSDAALMLQLAQILGGAVTFGEIEGEARILPQPPDPYREEAAEDEALFRQLASGN